VFDHVTIRVSDQDVSERFYETVLPLLGLARTGDRRYVEWGDFSIAEAADERAVTRRLHIGFTARSRELVDEFWRVGTAAGYRDDGAPGLRPQYDEDYYGAFLLDPDGNSIEAVHHGDVASRGCIDHLWMRVADLAASRRFYETVAPFAGFELQYDGPERASFGSESGGFSVVRGTPTEHAHIAFSVPDDAIVEHFHRAALEAGYRDNGAPGERPVYHAGYYGAYVLDPDGNNVELVNHNRGA
jgi:catechol 2,3-dioxygenase-like lactoylglutathione lyase family enzyme